VILQESGKAASELYDQATRSVCSMYLSMRGLFLMKGFPLDPPTATVLGFGGVSIASFAARLFPSTSKGTVELPLEAEEGPPELASGRRMGVW
jgi:hypothetical protein